MILPRIFVLISICAFVGCSAPISFELVEPPVPAALVSEPAPEDLGLLLDQIAKSEQKLKKSDPATYQSYNYLVSRLIDEIQKSGFKPGDGTIAIRGAKRVYRFSVEESEDLRHLGQSLIPTDRLKFSGDYVLKETPPSGGVGAPLVMSFSDPALAEKQSPFVTPYRNLTAIVNVKGNGAVLRLFDPFEVEKVAINGASRPLNADYDSAVSYGLSEMRIDKLGFSRMLNPSRYNDTAKLSFTQPYDPERIPVLFVHGLQSTPATWMPMYLELVNDPEIRKKYQFWTFSYPSGYPFPYSATLLRKEMDRVARVHSNHQKIVIVGHSMGTLLSRLMISDAGDKMWIAFFGKTPEKTLIDRKSRRLLEDSLIFDSRDDISRAIFYSGPHRGSELATGWIGRLGSRLIRAPALLADTRNAIVNIVTVDTAALQLDRAPNSIDTLAPNNRIVLETSKLPRRSDIPVHSIMGDRGDDDTPDSSDGIVPYWSSHLENQASEKIVPSGHGSHQHPEGISEARRILRLHAGLPATD
ncbi:MAG: alpha/beta fold hydrolase [Akkermansiaceae bacterium]|nr:alpha/beta fold hydrolase [Akkermansiaceae bacterium]